MGFLLSSLLPIFNPTIGLTLFVATTAAIRFFKGTYDSRMPFAFLIGAIVGVGLFTSRGDGDGLWVLAFPAIVFWWFCGLGIGRFLVRWTNRAH